MNGGMKEWMSGWRNEWMKGESQKHTDGQTRTNRHITDLIWAYERWLECRGRKTEKHTDGQSERDTDRDGGIVRQIDRQTNRQCHSLTWSEPRKGNGANVAGERQIVRQTQSDKDRYKETGRQRQILTWSEPTKEMARMSGLSMIKLTALWVPWITFTQPSGTPDRRMNSRMDELTHPSKTTAIDR